MTHLIDPFHERVARTALAVAEEHGFVLGGGLALIAHGTLSRPTADVDLFGPESAPVAVAAQAVRTALRAVGMRCEDIRYEGELSQVIDGLDDHMVEMVAYRDDADRDGVALSLAHLETSRRPVRLSIGPVMDMSDLIAYKTAALVPRGEVRDFIDVSVFLADLTPQELIDSARRVDPGLLEEDVVAVSRRLDRTPDRAFEPYGLPRSAVASLRERVVAWPR